MRILSGIQPSGLLHLGNYFGMMRPSIQLQEEGDAFYFIADFHSLTTVSDPEALRSHARAAALDFLACGLDPEKAVFFRQSDVPEVTELSWILSCICPFGLLERCHTYKDKTAKGIEATHGLFAYPVLMAADILLYDSEVVPVGKDQKQHLEVTRDLALKLNRMYGEDTVTVPEARIQESVERIRGIDGEKMSKSYENTIPLFAPEKATRKQVMKIKTDSAEVDDPKDPDDSIIFELYSLIAEETDRETMAEEFRAGGTGYGEFKKRLFGAIWEEFAPFRTRREELEADPAYVESLLQAGAERARETASVVLQRVRKAVGLRS
ncbi:MAG: tryptophan--tRNA ligase [Verrucomicrobiota bacterium]